MLNIYKIFIYDFENNLGLHTEESAPMNRYIKPGKGANRIRYKRHPTSRVIQSYTIGGHVTVQFTEDARCTGDVMP